VRSRVETTSDALPRARPDRQRTLDAVVAEVAAAGVSLTLVVPGAAPLRLGDDPERTRVRVRTAGALQPLLRHDHLALGEAYVHGAIDVEGDLLQLFKLADVLPMASGPFAKLGLWLRLRLPGRAGYARRTLGLHYDREPEFFLGWLERWRSYSHGIYASPDDDAAEAQARKMQLAIDALGLRPGMEVLDMGAGWGCFVEYAGLKGIHVRGITVSEVQHRFVSDLIRDRRLPCSVELVDFRDYRPRAPLDGAVFMGTLEHLPDYRRVARFLARHLRPGAAVYADFCARHADFLPAAFLRRYVWPGPATYVDLGRLVAALMRAGFNVHELADDTSSYTCTVRDWGDALEAGRAELAARFGEALVRVFLLFLRGSQYFLETNRTQAYHLVASRASAPLRPAASATRAATRQSAANASPIRP
jgi:cyclopropane-fatty-acyl-phospholipid synthase